MRVGNRWVLPTSAVERLLDIDVCDHFTAEELSPRIKAETGKRLSPDTVPSV